MIKNSLFFAVLATALTACALPPKYDWTKDDASSEDKNTALSECSYQIKLSKAKMYEQSELLSLCMQGKGYRYKKVERPERQRDRTLKALKAAPIDN